MKIRTWFFNITLITIVFATTSCVVSREDSKIKPDNQNHEMVLKVVFLSDGSARIIDTHMPEELAKYIPKSTVQVKNSYVIGAYHPKDNDYNFKNYDEQKTSKFLAIVLNEYSEGDIISIDGLKWIKKQYAMVGDDIGGWEPFPNPPIPIYDSNEESMQEHISEYAKWINDHPHFGYPPLPINTFESD